MFIRDKFTLKKPKRMSQVHLSVPHSTRIQLLKRTISNETRHKNLFLEERMSLEAEQQAEMSKKVFSKKVEATDVERESASWENKVRDILFW